MRVCVLTAGIISTLTRKEGINVTRVLIIKDGKVLVSQSMEEFNKMGERMLMEADKRDASIGEYAEWVNFGEGRDGQ